MAGSLDLWWVSAKLWRSMRYTQKQLAMTCLLIAAQLCVIVFGHGRVVICRDDGGPTHIELVRQESCSVRDDAAWDRVAGSFDEAFGEALGEASWVQCTISCVDEVFGLTYTLASARRAIQGGADGFEPTSTIAMLSMLMTRDSGGLVARAESQFVVDGPGGYLASLRSTVLVL